MTEESLMILELLRDGKISAPEAERLLRTVRETATASATPSGPPQRDRRSLGQAAVSVAKLAGRAWKYLPKPLPKPGMDTGRIGDQISVVANEALRTAREVATEIGKITEQSRQAWRSDAAAAPKTPSDQPANGAARPEATDTTQTEATWSGAERLVLVNAYGDIRATVQDDLHGTARATLTKMAWAESEGAARTLLQQVFLVSQVERGSCRLEVIAPIDAAGRLRVTCEIFVPKDIPLEIRTSSGSTA